MDRYRKIGEAEKHVYGERAVIPNFNVNPDEIKKPDEVKKPDEAKKIEAKPPAPKQQQ